MISDLQKVTLQRLLKTTNHTFYTKLTPQYFTGVNLILFNRIQSFYKANLKLPTHNEFLLLHKNQEIQEYLESQIFTEKEIDLSDDFLIAQLEDYSVREKVITFLDDFLTNLQDYEKDEIVDSLQTLLYELNDSIDTKDEVIDASQINVFSTEEAYKLYPSGLSSEYDSVNGGFATQELVLLGGRRGSGKSIISLNVAHTRFSQGSTVAFFTIEMRFKEVNDRLMSIISGVPFLTIYKNELTFEQKLQILKAKGEYFYASDSHYFELYENLLKHRDLEKFQAALKDSKPKLKENRLLFIDDPVLTMNKIDSTCHIFKNKYPNFTLSVVDYLNIIHSEDQKDWKNQITYAEGLKRVARQEDLTMFSPIQIDATGEARFAKGILDSADRSFSFMPADQGDDPNKLKLFTSKIRMGKAMTMEIPMDWECVRLAPQSSVLISERLRPRAKYGSENSSDIPNE